MQMQEIPMHIDDPAQFFMWYLDEVIVMSVSFVLGILTNHLTWGVVGSIIVAKIYRKFREGHQTNYIQHLVYWHGGYPSTAFSVPNPFIRKWC